MLLRSYMFYMRSTQCRASTFVEAVEQELLLLDVHAADAGGALEGHMLQQMRQPCKSAQRSRHVAAITSGQPQRHVWHTGQVCGCDRMRREICAAAAAAVRHAAPPAPSRSTACLVVDAVLSRVLPVAAVMDAGCTKYANRRERRIPEAPVWPSWSSKAPTLAYVWQATTGALRRCLTMKCMPFDSVNSLMVPSRRVSRSALPSSAAATSLSI